MDKNSILEQLEEKLLPSVRNLTTQQQTEHDFFPALLWTLLEINKNTESLLKEIAASAEENKKIYERQLAGTADFIVSESDKINKAAHEKTDQLIESQISIIHRKTEEIKAIQLKTERKMFSGFLVLAIAQLITLSILIFMAMKSV